MNLTEADRILLRVRILLEHLHNDRKVYPWGAVPVTLTSGAGAFTWGVYSADIVAAGAITYPFDFHWCILSDASANCSFEIILVYGAGDTECGQISFTRSAPQANSSSIGINTVMIPANSRVRAIMRDSIGGNSIGIKIAGHDYEFLTDIVNP